MRKVDIRCKGSYRREEIYILKGSRKEGLYKESLFMEGLHGQERFTWAGKGRVLARATQQEGIAFAILKCWPKEGSLGLPEWKALDLRASGNAISGYEDGQE
jgi:hypothetical protein